MVFALRALVNPCHAYCKFFTFLSEAQTIRLHSSLFVSLYHFSIALPGSSSSISTLVSSDSSLASESNPIVFNYLVENCGLSDCAARLASKRLPRITSTERPDSVLRIIGQYGLNDMHIRECVRICPPILLVNCDKTVKPNFEFLLELGLSGSNLCLVVSKNPKLLMVDLNRRLKPCVEVLKKVLSDDKKALLQVLRRCKWVLYKDPKSRLLPNISFFQSCGIVGSQLVMLLKRQPALFVMSKSKLEEFVSRVIELGVPVTSRMFVYALYTLSCMTPEKLQRKFALFCSYGFTDQDVKYVFQTAPSLIRCSEKRLVSVLEFFIHVAGIESAVLIKQPKLLMNSLEKRIAPRYRVLQILRSKLLLKKEPSLLYWLIMSEADFFRYLTKFKNSEELLVAYKGEIVDS